MKLATDPTSGLLLPTALIDEKQSLKKSIESVVEQAINSINLDTDYFLVLHARFDKVDPSVFVINKMVASIKMPPFTSNQMVFWVSPRRGLVELLWIVPAKMPGEKLKPEFNTKGVAYLQAKGVMPTQPVKAA